MTAEALAKAIQARRHGHYWIARCIAHDDDVPSLSITERDGKLFLKCFAGCTQGQLIDALRARNLWSHEPAGEHPRKWGTIVKTYDYRDEYGELLYQVCRLEPKCFRPRRPDGQSGWTWKKHPNQILYRLSEVLEAPIVFLVEGEKDVETLRAHGFVATTAAGGANAPWLDSYTVALRGREVILIPDRDYAGRTRVVRIAKALLGRVAKLVILDLEHSGKDVTDWFAAGHSELEFMSLAEGEAVS